MAGLAAIARNCYENLFRVLVNQADQPTNQAGVQRTASKTGDSDDHQPPRHHHRSERVVVLVSALLMLVVFRWSVLGNLFSARGSLRQ